MIGSKVLSERENSRTSKPRRVKSAAAAQPPLPAPKIAIFFIAIELLLVNI
jgi:hypothetical protein